MSIDYNKIENDIKSLLTPYISNFNDVVTRSEIKKDIKNYLDKNSENLYSFDVIMDETNNTADIINDNMAILDVVIKHINATSFKFIRISMLPNAVIESTGFMSI